MSELRNITKRFAQRLGRAVRRFLQWSGLLTEEMCHPTGEQKLRALLHTIRQIDFVDIDKINEDVVGKSSRFTVEVRARKSLQFSIPFTQAGTIRAAFSAKLPSRFVDRDAPSVWQKLGELLPVGRRARPPQKRQPPAYSKRRGWLFKILGIVYWLLLASPLTDYLPESVSHNQNFLTLLWMPVPLLVYHGYQLCQNRYEPGNGHDTRKPILFLRAFDDDSTTTLQPIGPLAAFSGVKPSMWPLYWPEEYRFRIIDLDMVSAINPVRLLRMIIDHAVGSSEESLVRFFEKYGPVIATGGPADGLAIPGSARAYLHDDQWQGFVSTELQRSQAVILQPGPTAGIKWELEEVRKFAAPPLRTSMPSEVLEEPSGIRRISGSRHRGPRS